MISDQHATDMSSSASPPRARLSAWIVLAVVAPLLLPAALPRYDLILLERALALSIASLALKKIRVARTQTAPINAARAAEVTTPAAR